MTPDEQNWLTWGAIRHRPNGATRWHEAGTRAAIAKHCATWGLPEATAHVLAHARDPKANTPNVIASRYTPDNEPQVGGHRHPPRIADECPEHAGQYASACSGCAADDLGPRDEDPGPPLPADMDGLTGREKFRQARAELDLRMALEARPKDAHVGEGSEA